MKINEVTKPNLAFNVGRGILGLGAKAAEFISPTSALGKAYRESDPVKFRLERAQALRQARQTSKYTQSSQDPTSTTQDVINWNPDKNVLTFAGLSGVAKYQKTKKGWKDIQTGEIILPQYAKEIQAAFDKASGRIAPTKPRISTKNKPIQIKAPNGEIITKNESDGKWYDAEGAEIVIQADIDELERRAISQYQSRQMAKGI